MRLAIVIPTLDEERRLPEILPPAFDEADEVWISDGGSRDRTVEIARDLGARVVEGDAGRGRQLNRGAARASAEGLLFLHADTVLPPGAGEAVRRALADGAVGGGFEMRFEPAPRTLALWSRVINLRTRLTRCPLGDQAQFVRRGVFDALGGFRDWPILEDLDFARRLKRQGKAVVLPLAVTTSARRYLARGAARTFWTNGLIFALYFAGVSPRRLARLYRHVR